MLGWLAGGNQLGEVVAKRLGYLEEEGLHLEIHPGGPHIDGVGIVASGRYQLGQVSLSPSLMLAVGQGDSGAMLRREHATAPVLYFSLLDKHAEGAAAESPAGPPSIGGCREEVLVDLSFCVGDDPPHILIRPVFEELTELFARDLFGQLRLELLRSHYEARP